MKIIQNFEIRYKKIRNPVVTIGNFDGVHKGHQSLIEKIRKKAQELDGESVVMTFYPHPLKVLRPDCNLQFITPHKRKLELLAHYGVDVTWVIPFSREFASISPQDFVKTYLVDYLNVKWIIVGYDYHFGKNRAGNIEFLKQQGEKFGFGVESVSEIVVGGLIVSSTSVRKLIRQGQMQTVANLLGRPYEIRGKVVRGRNRGGRLLGFPTANVNIGEYVPPKIGVYAVKVIIDGKTYNGAANCGYNPTFDDPELSLEIHILDFDRYIYNKEISVQFVKYIREEKKFSGIDELVDQIKRDVEAVRQILC